LNRDGTIKPEGRRGGYRQYPTHGGYDQMTARLGGFWDSMLGEGRRWWITSTSDSHKHWTEGGSDFWPGEFSKTYVYAERTHDDILSGIRNGRVFVTTGDLISELYVTAQTLGRGPRQTAGIGGTLALPNRNADVEVVIRIGGPLQANARGQWPQVQRVDVIVGEITGPVANREQDTNPTTRVEKRFSAKEWKEQDGYMTMRYVLPRVAKSCYIRVRGTNTDQLEPEADEPGEDPWSDLWFYSNPIFVHVN
jgi:hypothetical protein